MVQGVVGTGTHRKIILTPQLSRDTKYSCEGQSFAIPVATVEFASLCLRNALLLLPDSQPEDPLTLPTPHSTDVPTTTPSPSSHYVYAAPSNPLGSHEVANLRCSVLALSAYVALCLGDYIVALDHAQMLLVQPALSGVHRYVIVMMNWQKDIQVGIELKLHSDLNRIGAHSEYSKLESGKVYTRLNSTGFSCVSFMWCILCIYFIKYISY